MNIVGKKTVFAGLLILSLWILHINFGMLGDASAGDSITASPKSSAPQKADSAQPPKRRRQPAPTSVPTVPLDPYVEGIAVAVLAGGDKDSKLQMVDICYRTHLHRFSNIAVFGDYTEESPSGFPWSMEKLPRHFLCAEDSSWGKSVWDDNVFAATDRPLKGNQVAWGGAQQPAWSLCVQMKFLYALITIQERYPHATAWMITEPDVLIDVDAFATFVRMRRLYDRIDPWVLSSRAGTPMVFSRRLYDLLPADKLLACMSKAMMTNNIHGDLMDTNTWSSCYNTLKSTCGWNKKQYRTVSGFQSCVENLARGFPNCEFDKYARPEYKTPILVDPATAGHNIDHMVPGCVNSLVNYGVWVFEAQYCISYNYLRSSEEVASLLKYDPPQEQTSTSCKWWAYHHIHPDQNVELAQILKIPTLQPAL